MKLCCLFWVTYGNRYLLIASTLTMLYDSIRMLLWSKLNVFMVPFLGGLWSWIRSDCIILQLLSSCLLRIPSYFDQNLLYLFCLFRVVYGHGYIVIASYWNCYHHVCLLYLLRKHLKQSSRGSKDQWNAVTDAIQWRFLWYAKHVFCIQSIQRAQTPWGEW